MRRIAILVSLFVAACGPSSDSETHWGDNDEEKDNQVDNSNHGGNDNDEQNNSTNSYEPSGLQVSLNRYFDDVPVGESQTNTLILSTFDGDEVVTIHDVTFGGDHFSVDLPIDEWPDEIDGMTDFEAGVTYEPTTEVEQFGELLVNWSTSAEEDGEIYESVMPLYGNRACLTTDVNRLIFSDIDVGDSESQTVEITNCGGVSFFEVSPTIEQSASTVVHSIVNVDDFPHLLLAGDSIEIEVEYAPTEPFVATDHWYYLDIQTDSSVATTIAIRNEGDQDCTPTDQNASNGGEGQNDMNDWNANQSTNDWDAEYCEPVVNNGEGSNGEELNGGWNDFDDGD